MSLLEWGDFYMLMAHSGFMAIAEWVSLETGVLLAGIILTQMSFFELFFLLLFIGSYIAY